MVTMENQLHAAAERSGRLRRKNARRRAGVPAKRFFTRFPSLADVPAEDLEFLSQSLRNSLDLDPASHIPALRAMLGQELRNRKQPGRE